MYYVSAGICQPISGGTSHNWDSKQWMEWMYSVVDRVGLVDVMDRQWIWDEALEFGSRTDYTSRSGVNCQDPREAALIGGPAWRLVRLVVQEGGDMHTYLQAGQITRSSARWE